MRNIFAFLIITIISTTAYAEKSLNKLNPEHIEQKKLVHNLSKTLNANSMLMLAKNEANNLLLWNFLDTNKDESISKIEALCAKELIDRWDELDSNKDGRLDFMDFSRLSNQKS